jgi:hypothetical protein
MSAYGCIIMCRQVIGGIFLPYSVSSIKSKLIT